MAGKLKQPLAAEHGPQGEVQYQVGASHSMARRWLGAISCRARANTAQPQVHTQLHTHREDVPSCLSKKMPPMKGVKNCEVMDSVNPSACRHAQAQVIRQSPCVVT